MHLSLPPNAQFRDGWHGDLASARALQKELATRVVLAGPAVDPPRFIAGVDAGLEDAGRTMHAAAVLIDATTLSPIADAVARLPVAMPYVPGMLSFRELPAILAALAQLPTVPDLIMCDGHGIAHPRRLGIAAHLGVWSGLPTLGVAKKRLCGSHAEPAITRGARTALVERGDWIGTVLRTRERVAPVFVSPGHRVSLERAADLVMAVTTRYRLPEPTRLADRLASQRERRPPERRLC